MGQDGNRYMTHSTTTKGAQDTDLSEVGNLFEVLSVPLVFHMDSIWTTSQILVGCQSPLRVQWTQAHIWK